MTSIPNVNPEPDRPDFPDLDDPYIYIDGTPTSTQAAEPVSPPADIPDTPVAAHLTSPTDDSGDISEADGLRGHREQLIIAARAEGLSYPQVAIRANCSERTVRRTCADPGVRQLIQERRDEMMDTADGLIMNLVGKALNQLDAVLDSDRPADQLGAARLVLRQFTDARDRREILDKLADLEAQVAALNPTGGDRP